MTPIEVIDIAAKLANLGLAPVLLVGMWQLWRAYQTLVDDLRKVNDRLDTLALWTEGETKPVLPVNEQ